MITATDGSQRPVNLTTLLEATRADKKPDLAEMRAWVDRQYPCLLQSAEAYRDVYGEFHPDQIRAIAVASQLIEFIDQCAEHEEDIVTIFRAAAHRKNWRKS